MNRETQRPNPPSKRGVPPPSNSGASHEDSFVKRLSIGLLLVAFFVTPLRTSARPYINGWTKSTFRSGVQGCVASAVPKQMQFMQTSEQIKPDATPAQIEATRTMVTRFETAVCTCAQNQIMHDINFSEVQTLRQRPDYARNLMERCSRDALRKRK